MMVAIPERFGRRMSIGPFEDPRDFLKFCAFAMVSAVVALAAGLIWGLPIVALGAVLTLIRSDDEPLFSHFVRWTSFLISRRTGHKAYATLSAGAICDPWGRRWRFYSHDPFPVYGRDPEELLRHSLGLVGVLSTIPAGECVVVRVSRPFKLQCSELAESEDSREDVESYRKLLEDAVKGKYRSELLVGIPVSPRSGRETETRLVKDGWCRVTGSELAGLVRGTMPGLGIRW